MNPNRLLVIDDEPKICTFVADVAAGCGYDAAMVNNPDEFWIKYRDFDPTVMVLDLQMPEVDGIEWLRRLADDGCRAKILLISGQAPRILSSAKRLGAAHGLTMLGELRKPIQLAELETQLNAAKLPEPAVTEPDLRVAIAERQLVVYYQPVASRVSEDAWRIGGAEALVRWNHPRHGLIMPDAFLPMVVGSGLIDSLTDQVFTSAVDQVKRWRDAGLSLTVSINLAPQLLGDVTLPDRFVRILGERNVPPSAVIMEITESGAMVDAAVTIDILTRFRLKGFGLSLDDFGTGYSSLVQLYRMPFNELKIDKTFVMAMMEDEEADVIVRLITQLAHNLELTVCAEGVECREVLNVLGTLGCEKAQGYFFGKAKPPVEMAAVIANWND